jgi:hypothetical protein
VTEPIQYENTKNLITQRHLQNFSNYAGTLGDHFPDAPNWSDPNRTPTRAGAGATLFGFANSNYGSAGGWAQFVGTLTNRLKIAKKTETVKLLNDAAAAVNTPALRAELDLITNKLRSSPEAWVVHPADNKLLIQRKEYSAVSKGGTPSETINMSEQVSDFLRTHSSINSQRQVHVKNHEGYCGSYG